MVEPVIGVRYLHGLKPEVFSELNDLGLDVFIPEERKKLPIQNSAAAPEDFIVIFTIYFSIRFAEELTKKVVENLADKTIATVKKIWNGQKKSKPALLIANQEPQFKEPKAVLRFKVSENEESTLEITNDIDQENLDALIKAKLKLVKMQYKHRQKEASLVSKIDKLTKEDSDPR